MKEIDRLKRAFVPASAEFHRHIAATLDNMEELTMRKTSPRISVVAVVLIIALIAGVALAAAHFGVLDFITYRDPDGSVKFNEILIPHVQPIGKILEGEAANVTLHDAICDGASMSLAWTINNKLPDEEVYVYWSLAIWKDDISVGYGDMTPTEFLLPGGGSREGGITTRLTPFLEGGTLDVSVTFVILAPEREVVQVDALSTDTDQLLAEGKMVMKWDSIQLPYENYLDNESKTDALVRLGYMRQLDAFVIPLTLDVTSGVTDILDRADKTEVLSEDHRMVLSSIEYTPTTLRYTVDFVFEEEALMIAFIEERRSMAIMPIYDESGFWYGLAESFNPDAPYETDGTWVLRYECVITDIFQMPEEIDIIPHNARTKQAYDADERFHISIPKQ